MDNLAELKMGPISQPDSVPSAPRNKFINHYHVWLAWSFEMFKQFWLTVILAVWGITCYFLATHFIFMSVLVDGHSMVPALADSEKCWVNRLAYIRSEPRPADIVAVKDPRDGTLIVKRIIAMPGQSLYLRQGKVYVNGKLLNEPYLSSKIYTFAFERSADEFICVGKDEYFVMGDNRNNSTDSRTFGTVPRANILGKLIR